MLKMKNDVLFFKTIFSTICNNYLFSKTLIKNTIKNTD